METISMSIGERKRLEVFSRVKAKEMTLVEACTLLKVSYRQTKRIWSHQQLEWACEPNPPPQQCPQICELRAELFVPNRPKLRIRK